MNFDQIRILNNEQQKKDFLLMLQTILLLPSGTENVEAIQSRGLDFKASTAFPMPSMVSGNMRSFMILRII